MCKQKEVEDKEGEELAKELGAIFQLISAKESTGIEDLFLKIGKKFIEQNPTESSNAPKIEDSQKERKLKSDQKAKNGNGSKGCLC